jgi:hypothetical protein
MEGTKMAVTFLGAGFSKTFGIPTMEEMTQNLLQLKLDVNEQDLLKSIRERLSNYEHYDIEAVMTVLDYLSDPKRMQKEVVNNAPTQFFIDPKESWSSANLGALNRCYKTGNPDKVKKAITEYIKSVCQMKPEKDELFPLLDELFILLSLHIGGLDLRRILGKKPVGNQFNHEVFTTNYDNVLCVYANRRGAPRINGELPQNKVGIRKVTNTQMFDRANHGLKIYRLHGYITWFIDKHTKDIRYSGEVLPPGKSSLLGDQPEREAMIFPIGGKYIYREPYCDMFFYLKELLTTEKLVTVIGYSFRDADVVGLFADALTLNPELKMILLDPRAKEIIKDRFGDFFGRVLPAIGNFDSKGLHSLERELARLLILRNNQMPGESIEVQDVVSEDIDFENAFIQSCEFAGEWGNNWKLLRDKGILELFKVIFGSKFKVEGYNWENQLRVDVSANHRFDLHG